MNDDLRELVLAAGAPKQMINQLWFQVFCEQFAYILLEEAERSMTEEV